MKIWLTAVLSAALAWSTVARADGDMKQVAADNNAFALDLFQQLRAEPGNVFFSPYSISTALAMTAAGARGETEK